VVSAIKTAGALFYHLQGLVVSSAQVDLVVFTKLNNAQPILVQKIAFGCGVLTMLPTMQLSTALLLVVVDIKHKI